MTRIVQIGKVKMGGESPLVLIAGPCVIEGEEETLAIARQLKEIAQQWDVPLVFKASYDKANRSSIRSYRGPGWPQGLQVLQRVKEEVGLPVLSDVHGIEQVEAAAQVLDVLQIPAFLCRQTDLVLAVASTGKPINVKKGQFLSPWDMGHVVQKITSTGNEQILLTERGTSFGYNNLVVDMRSLVVMRELSYPVVFDATHSVQLPGGAGHISGGQREFIPYLARGAIAVGCDALFCEVHPEPEKALSDSHSMLRLSDLPGLIDQWKRIDALVRSWNSL
ncbi:MAG: 3-deoxy-8-phosphooctulonate synthase [Candidatus Tectomicrobia bacterium]|uniref:2-dehydro-3-deoxyphosphooctonate aldolase n=1 Tax=Tectimicrobiota bacterium TaxID=2528274 RepID=A0A932FW81_UNCTE|nr:3-deoxy-8-phosphooctulonate synthase [Candidatus Tectomicrobia bacterium]